MGKGKTSCQLLHPIGPRVSVDPPTSSHAHEQPSQLPELGQAIEGHWKGKGNGP
jgi:hypothetical protein